VALARANQTYLVAKLSRIVSPALFLVMQEHTIRSERHRSHVEGRGGNDVLEHDAYRCFGHLAQTDPSDAVVGRKSSIQFH
jgi:hypothetical protein